MNTDPTQQQIEKLFAQIGLGEVDRDVVSVSGGFMHRMYRVHTPRGTYAVKHLNPGVMSRPDAMRNYEAAEQLEGILERAGIPIVPALSINGRKMQICDGEHYYIFDWHEGSTTDWDHITPDQCRMAGSILGRIHALEPADGGDESGDVEDDIEESHIDWDSFLGRSQSSAFAPDIYDILSSNIDLLRYAETEMNRARHALPAITCISDEDMDPKNVMWENGQPLVIDLECLSHGNPVSHVLQLSLQWSGITTCSLDTDLIRAYFDGYRREYDNGFRAYADVFGVAYTWLEWLEYNLDRALGNCTDPAEQELGATEVRNTLNRIRYLCDRESTIKQTLSLLTEY